jgi:MinD-like ATPase involved in chromosome partitioning or flagellar assembly
MPRDYAPAGEAEPEAVTDAAAPQAPRADPGPRPAEPPAPEHPPTGMTRDDVYSRPMAAGRAVADGPASRFGGWLRELLKTKLERHEDGVDAQLTVQPGVTRPNVVAVVSPKGGVGKTTTSFLLGNLVAEALRLRVIAVDANPDFGTLAALAPDAVRSPRSQIDLLEAADELTTGAQLHHYVSRLPTGLHLLGAPAQAELMAAMTPERYEQLLGVLRRFYEVIIMDLGTGITDPIAQFATRQADHVAIVATPEWITSANVLGALRYLDLDSATLVLNQSLPKRGAGNREVIEANFRRHAISDRVSIPFDPQLRTMLDSGTYDLRALARTTRVPVKELGLTVARGLV